MIPFSEASIETLGETITVDDDGGADYTNIQDAINSATDGDTIYVYSGTYYEDVKINTSIVLQGEDKESTIIHGGGFGSGDAVVYVSADNVEITGFSISNSCPYWPGSGIGLYRNEQCIVTENIVKDCFIGIHAFITSDTTISMNTVSDNEFGIRVQASKRNSITRNTMQDNQCGMYLNGANFNEITENNFINNDRHFDFYGVFLNTISGNYWERVVNIGPKPILGTLSLWIPIPGIIYDWNPASEPFAFPSVITENEELNNEVYTANIGILNRVLFDGETGRCFLLHGHPIRENISVVNLGYLHYSDAVIDVGRNHYEGDGIIFLIGYRGSTEYNEINEHWTWNGYALACFVIGK
jgi:parallel beta-helix repeat protein